MRLLTSWWAGGPPYYQLGNTFLFYAGGEGRLQATNVAANINFLTDPPTHPFHYMYLDSGLEKKISDVAVRAFGVPLVLNRHAGSMIPVHVGEAPPATHGAGAPPREYLKALSALPRLDQQGDGMKSFLGLMLYVLTAAYPLVFVDEPEALLHPPQAQLLGRMLGDLTDDRTPSVLGLDARISVGNDYEACHQRALAFHEAWQEACGIAYAARWGGVRTTNVALFVERCRKI